MLEKYWVHAEGCQADVKMSGKVTVRNARGELIQTIDLDAILPTRISVNVDDILEHGNSYGLNFSLNLPLTFPGANDD